MLDLWDPFGALVRFERAATARPGQGQTPRAQAAEEAGDETERAMADRRPFAPPVEVLLEDRDLVARFELPGLGAEDVTVDLEGGRLVVSGERRTESERRDVERAWLHREVHYGSFRRSVRLPEGADPEKVSATFDKGVLEVRVADAVPGTPQPRRVPVSVGGSSEQTAVGSGSADVVEQGGAPAEERAGERATA